MSFTTQTLAQYKKVNALALAAIKDNMDIISMLEDELVASNKLIADGTHTVADLEEYKGDGVGCDMDAVNGWDLHGNASKLIAAFSTLYTIDDMLEKDNEDYKDAMDTLAS